MNVLKIQRLDLRYLRQELDEEEYQRYRAAMRGAGLWTEDTVLDKLTSLDKRTLGCACHPLTDATCSVCRTQANERQAGYKAPKSPWDYDVDELDKIDDTPF